MVSPVADVEELHTFCKMSKALFPRNDIGGRYLKLKISHCPASPLLTMTRFTAIAPPFTPPPLMVITFGYFGSPPSPPSPSSASFASSAPLGSLNVNLKWCLPLRNVISLLAVPVHRVVQEKEAAEKQKQ
jgi:hypothetical protein